MGRMAHDEEDADREAIVRRRNRLIAAALTGIVSSTAQACACLSVSEPDSGRHLDDAGRDGGARRDASTMDAAMRDGSTADAAADAATADAAVDASEPEDASLQDASVSVDGGPVPCLTIIPGDGGPLPCLSPAIDFDSGT